MLLGALGIGGGLGLACSDRTTELVGCYPEGREWERDPSNGWPLGVCEWSKNDIPDDFPTDGSIDGYSAITHCFTLEEGQVCDACPADETDALLREVYAEQCGNEISYFRRGCYNPAPEEDGKPRCCYTALIGPVCTQIE